jgi:hypothetical protein
MTHTSQQPTIHSLHVCVCTLLANKVPTWNSHSHHIGLNAEVDSLSAPPVVELLIQVAVLPTSNQAARKCCNTALCS